MLDVSGPGTALERGCFADWLCLETTEANGIKEQFIHDRCIWMENLPGLLNSECRGAC